MKKLSVTVLLSISLVLSPQVAVADNAGGAGNAVVAADGTDGTGTAAGGTDASGSSSSSSGTATDYKEALGGVKEVWTTILAMAAVAGALAVVGKIGADIIQQQTTGA